MAAYDSDSSGDLDDYTETSTLLGYVSQEPTDDVFSQVGGRPTWLDGKMSPSAVLGRCKVCNDHMSLLLQLNGDLPEKFPGHERRLYLFGCRRKTCRRKEGSVRGVRASRVTKSQAKSAAPASLPPSEVKTAASSTDIGNQLFGGSSAIPAATGGNPFSSNPFSHGIASVNPFASASSLAAKPAQRTDISSLPDTFASKARITDSKNTDQAFGLPKATEPHEPWPTEGTGSSPYPKYFLDADYETLDKPKLPEASRTTGTLEDTEMGGTSSSGASTEDKQLFESTMDKTFQKFADRLEQNPEQVLRYEFDGQPLLYSSADAVGKRLAPEHAAAKVGTMKQGSGIPRCSNCGGERVFELQLTPHAITELEADETSLEGMDWGTIIMGVCSKDCVPAGTEDKAVGYVEEWVGVQWEELAEKRK